MGTGEQRQVRGQLAVELLIEGDAEVALAGEQEQGEGADVHQANLVRAHTRARIRQPRAR